MSGFSAVPLYRTEREETREYQSHGFNENLSQMQEQMKDVQEKLKDVKAEGAAGGDLVKVVINGKMEVEDIKIDPIAVDPRDVAMLEELILSAIEGATQSIKEKSRKRFPPIPLPRCFPDSANESARTGGQQPFPPSRAGKKKRHAHGLLASAG